MYSTREQGPTLSLNEILILAFKRVFKWIPILKSYFHKHRYQLKNSFRKNLKWWWYGPFALGLIFSPPLALIAKNKERWSPFIFSSPLKKEI
jgi:mannose/fructose/N-acetylgalactosamine-specific phosphotransferase system component IID